MDTTNSISANVPGLERLGNFPSQPIGLYMCSPVICYLWLHKT